MHRQEVQRTFASNRRLDVPQCATFQLSWRAMCFCFHLANPEPDCNRIQTDCRKHQTRAAIAYLARPHRSAHQSDPRRRERKVEIPSNWYPDERARRFWWGPDMLSIVKRHVWSSQSDNGSQQVKRAGSRETQHHGNLAGCAIQPATLYERARCSGARASAHQRGRRPCWRM